MISSGSCLVVIFLVLYVKNMATEMLVEDLLSFMQPDFPKNLHGEALQPCSTDSMAVTGFTRDGLCSHHNEDKGSHHICVTNIQSTNNEPSFCNITEQSNWCDDNGKCSDGRSCPREKWCVCEWAFERFVKEKGCDAFDIDTKATNHLVLDHYLADPVKHKEAYYCIEKKMLDVSP